MEGKKKVFISHTKTDYEQTQLGTLLCDALIKNNYEVFCSSDPNTQIETGKQLHEEMNRQLRECDIFLALVTENYLRSSHCIYEMSVTRFLKKQQPIIIYANESILSRLSDIANPEWISIILSNENEVINGCQRLTQTFEIKEEKQQEDINRFLLLVTKTHSANRPYIGMSRERFNDLLLYCQKEGIVKFSNGNVYTKDEIASKFCSAKIIYIVSTTGAGLLKTLKEEALVRALGNKAQINIIIPDRDSTFCQDVANAECNRKEYNSIIAEQNRYRIEAEFIATIQYLNEAVCLAHEKYGNEIGEICCYSSQTLLRQTIVLVVSDTGSSWGWINMTMSPLRTTDTPSIAISDTNANKGLDKMIINHCECIMNISAKKQSFRRIDGQSSAEKLEHSEHESYWREKKLCAEKRMDERRNNSTQVLIEVAAQHPLLDGLTPNHEFKRRLDMAMFICKEIGYTNAWIYVPGSRHKSNGISDKISLSQAGKTYLIEHGVPKNHIFSDEANIMYKGDSGVYNSADESYVASKLFLDNKFGRMICICSPSQTIRKSFYYMEFGILPECYGVPDNEMYHDVVSEFFGSLHHTVYEDHDWQNIESEAAIKSRIDRMP